MGLFDFLRKSGPTEKKAPSQKELARLTRVVGNKLAQDYDRQEAIAALSEMKSGDGARALLKRFDFKLEPSITDQDEKEAAADGVIATGEAALPALRDYCVRAESIAWPLRILRKIVPEDHFVDELLELLEQFDTEYVRNPEPKTQLINALEEYPSEDVRLAVEPFLQDVNESVRFHAVGTVFAMNEPAACEALVRAMAEEESLRVRNLIARGIAQRGWSIPEAQREKCASALPEGFKLKDDKIST